MKLTRKNLKELIRQSIKEIDFKSQDAFDAYNKKHKMRKSTKVNVAGKDTTAGQASSEPEDKPFGGDTGKDADSNVPDSVKDVLDDTASTIGPNEAEEVIDDLGDMGYDTGDLEYAYEEMEEAAFSAIGGGSMDPEGEDMDPEDSEEYLDAVQNFRDEVKNIISGETNESIKESVKPPVRSTVKEIRTWMKTLEENRYKRLSNADCRRVSWMVNNNLAEDYESMPKSIVKKWSKAQYGRERFLAKEFVKHKRNEAKLRESIKKIIDGLIND